MQGRWGEIRYFERSEFDSPDQYGSGDLMCYDFIRLLDEARDIAESINLVEGTNVVFKINSGYRTREHNSKLRNSSPNSSHLKGLAADIKTRNGIDRRIILNSLITVGLNCRIGISRSFIHVDMDIEKSHSYWLYPSMKLNVLSVNNGIMAYANKIKKCLLSKIR